MTHKHTPEPWYVFSHYGDPEIRTKDSDKLVSAMLPSKIYDARRIVACVNACAGVPNEVLMTVGAFGGFGRDDMVRSVTAQRDDLQRELEQVKAAMKAQADGLVKQRDDLLSVCMKAAEEIRKCDYTPARSTLLVAIANVKGGTA